MTGTAMGSARELRRIYRCHVLPIPTNRPAIRQRLPDRVFGSAAAKWAAVAEEVCQLHAAGRPVLIGTRSIDKSEELSRLLSEAGIEHEVLNANHIAAEADIVAGAGQPGRVTVSTNMAGRGTDIKLGDGVADLGGLHVICTEMHDASRVDRQLIGRCGRQGDPGTFRQYLALDDDLLLAGLGPKKADKLEGVGREIGRPLPLPAQPVPQSAAEGRAPPFPARKSLMYFEKERKKRSGKWAKTRIWIRRDKARSPRPPAGEGPGVRAAGHTKQVQESRAVAAKETSIKRER